MHTCTSSSKIRKSHRSRGWSGCNCLKWVPGVAEVPMMLLRGLKVSFQPAAASPCSPGGSRSRSPDDREA